METATLGFFEILNEQIKHKFSQFNSPSGERRPKTCPNKQKYTHAANWREFGDRAQSPLDYVWRKTSEICLLLHSREVGSR